MAPKTLALPLQPAKEEHEREDPSDEEVEDSNEETDSDETEDEGSSEDEEENHKIAVPKSESKPILQVKRLDSEPDSEGSPSDYKLQPIHKPSASSAKRTRDENRDLSSSKKSKTEDKKSKIEEMKPSSEEKKSSSAGGGFITRLWSDEDEIAVLNGMVDFKKVKGLDYNSEGFYNFIKGKLLGGFTKDQLRTKISRMKKRFINALKKGDKGSDPVFSKPHEDMAFELSKKIWGDTINNHIVALKSAVKSENGKKDIVKAEKVEVDEKDEKATLKKDKDVEEDDFWKKYPFLSSSFLNMEGNFPSLAMSETSTSLLKKSLTLIGDVKAKELDQRWGQLITEELELSHKMLALMTEQTKIGLNHLRH